MDISFEIRKEFNKFWIWNVGIPRINTSIESKSFLVHGYICNLKLATKPRSYDSDEQWSMTLRYSDNKNPPCFPLRVYIQDKGRDVYLSQETISSQNAEIWKSYHSDFRKKYPDIEVVGTCLRFVFDFRLIVSAPEKPIKVGKSVQTADPNTPEEAKYPEEFPCLENLSLDLSKLVESSDTDMQLKCGDVSIGAHKLILGARSEVFRNMMQSDMVEGREGFVEIIDMEPKILSIFIKYIYSGILPELTVDTALPIYEAADKYQVEALKKRSSHFLARNLSPENALKILATADIHSDSDLKSLLVSYILKEKIPSREVEWLKFCNQYPKLAVEVLNSYYKLSNFSK